MNDSHDRRGWVGGEQCSAMVQIEGSRRLRQDRHVAEAFTEARDNEPKRDKERRGMRPHTKSLFISRGCGGKQHGAWRSELGKDKSYFPDPISDNK